MPRKHSKSVPREEKLFRMLEYLRRYTDEKHRISLRELEQALSDAEGEPFFGDRHTRAKLIREIALILNSDDEGHILPQKQWKLIYDDFKRLYGVYAPEDDPQIFCPDLDEDMDERGQRIKNLYYRREFTDQDIDLLLESIQFHPTLSKSESMKLQNKVKDRLATSFYGKDFKTVEKVHQHIPENQKIIEENLAILQEAIKKSAKIRFRFYGYNFENRLKPVRQGDYILSPYYLVSYAGRYYLLGADNKHMNASIWRVDLMKRIEIIEKEFSGESVPEAALPKQMVKGMPQKWNENYIFTHLNMAYDEPLEITLRILPWEGVKGTEDRAHEDRPDYTFLHDWFGKTWEYERTEKKAPHADIVKVTCSPYAMVNWALQYADRVEVLKPASVRKRVAEKVEMLKERYDTK